MGDRSHPLSSTAPPLGPQSKYLGGAPIIAMGSTSAAQRHAPLEPPLPNQKRPERTRRRDVLIPRQSRLAQDIPRIDPRLQPIPTQSSKTVYHLYARPLQSLRIERRLHRHESVRLDVLPELELRSPQEISDVGLDVGRSNRKEIGAERLCSTAGDL